MTPGADQDERRLQSVLQRRREKSRGVLLVCRGRVGSAARRSCLAIGFTCWRCCRCSTMRLVVGDLGCGTGQVSEAAGPARRPGDRPGWLDARCCRRPVIGCRASGTSTCARARSSRCRLTAATLDVAVPSLVLHHQPEPARVLGETARVLKPGGRVLVVDMLPHDRLDYQQQMGHVWLGFSDDDDAPLSGGGRLRRRPHAGAAGRARRAGTGVVCRDRDGRPRLESSKFRVQSSKQQSKGES